MQEFQKTPEIPPAPVDGVQVRGSGVTDVSNVMQQRPEAPLHPGDTGNRGGDSKETPPLSEGTMPQRDAKDIDQIRQENLQIQTGDSGLETKKDASSDAGESGEKATSQADREKRVEEIFEKMREHLRSTRECP